MVPSPLPNPDPHPNPNPNAARTPCLSHGAFASLSHAATCRRGGVGAQTTDELARSRTFFYVRVETDELLYFGMINSLFSLMLENEPSNHLHSILIPKAYLA